MMMFRFHMPLFKSNEYKNKIDKLLKTEEFKSLKPTQFENVLKLRNHLSRLEKNIHQLSAFLETEDISDLVILDELYRFAYARLASEFNAAAFEKEVSKAVKKAMVKGTAHLQTYSSFRPQLIATYNTDDTKDIHSIPRVADSNKLNSIQNTSKRLINSIERQKLPKVVSACYATSDLLLSGIFSFGVVYFTMGLAAGGLGAGAIALLVGFTAVLAAAVLLSTYSLYVEARFMADKQVNEIGEDVREIISLIQDNMELKVEAGDADLESHPVNEDAVLIFGPNN